MCRSSTCVCAIQTHTHTRVFIECTGACLGAARTCVRSCARHVCVCAHEKNEAAPVIVAVSRPPPAPPPPRPRTHPPPTPAPSPSPSHLIAVRTRPRSFARPSVGKQSDAALPPEAAGRAVRHGAHNKPSHSNILPGAQARSRTRAGGGGSEFDRKQLCGQRQQSAETYPRRLNIDSIGWASGLAPLQQ